MLNIINTIFGLLYVLAEVGLCALVAGILVYLFRDRLP